jgi:DNA-directed RNA polymerase, mitochondrial
MHYNLIKQTNRRYLEELNNRWHEFPKVTQSINIMQKTEWVINKPIYDVLKKCIRNDYDLGKLPVNPETIELPPKPFDIATNEEAKIKWKREAQKVYKNRAKSKSKYIQINQILAEAEHFLNCGGFFYPYQFDFRGRIYPKPAMLSPQSADYSRALLKFKFGKKMGDDEAFADFAIAGSGLYGEVDKQELKVRTEWIEQYAKRIIECATNPFEYTWWTEADKPFCFLAWCYEYKAFADTDFDASFVTTLPLQSDCSNSGLQHYSAMMLDEIGGKATNLVPSNKPADVYSLVANKVVMKLRDMPDSNYAKQWLEYGVDRKLCKKPVMCLPYSLTMKEIMGFLKDVSRLVASENLPVTWTSPLGLPIFMSCYKKESKRVKTMMGDSIIKLSLASETKLIDKRKTAQSICPNFIHSLDASVLQLAVVKANELGVDTFSLIHDSFGVVAPDVRLMAKALREAFCEIYSQDILANWAMEMKQMLSDKNKKKFKPIPAKGNLDLELVKQSLFFCI